MLHTVSPHCVTAATQRGGPVDSFDVIVIGGGPAGENIAGRCVDCGATIAVVERELRRRRVLVLGVHAEQGAAPPRRGAGGGAPGARARPQAVTGELDVAAVLARRDEIASNWDDNTRWSGSKAPAACSSAGTGGWSASGASTSSSPTASVRELEATKAVVIATGSSAVIPPIDGLRETRVWDSRAATSAQRRARAARRARRWRGRGRDGAGVEASRRARGDGDRGRRPARRQPRALRR